MNALVRTGVTMTSLELVEYINSQRAEGEAELTHANFMAKVPKVLGIGGVIHFQDTYLHPQNGQTYPCYRFQKREACLMAMSYSYDLQAKVFDRMTELETAPLHQHQIPKTLSEALWLAAGLADERDKAVAKLALDAPKLEAFDRIATADGAMCMTNAAKNLQTRPKDFFLWMQSNDWIFKRAGGGGWIAYQGRLKAGLLEHKVTTVQRTDGTEKIVEQVLVTAKGLALLAGLVGMRQAA